MFVFENCRAYTLYIEQLKKDIVVHHSNIKGNIVTRKVQHLLLTSLQKKFERMKKRLSVIKIPDPAIEGKCLTLIENAQLEEHQANFYLSKLETLLHKERTKVGVTKYLQKRIECKIRAVVETLYDFKYIVMCLLKCSTTGSSYIKLLLSLQNKLIKGQLKFRCGIVKSIETILRDTKYCSEDLKEVSENAVFEIMADSDDKEISYKPVLDEQKLETERSEEKEISTESSVFSEFDKTFKDTTLFDIDSEEHFTEFVEDEESLFDINEE
ncbi:uncharacterized protein LOC128885431 [Hylaeus anthracinus]|uniref:uncharacterized protein LOC128885431 n=1 Tax=Hylaeus anthracinus TaxID=313031 RepID=UPI0023B997E6|nr:uncharacterized protein LOC128885431 [Hylaeus anthracinus]